MILKERDNQIRKAANRIIEASLDIAKELETVQSNNVIELSEITDVSSDELKTTGVFFPGRPVCRHVKEVHINTSEARCTKIYQAIPSKYKTW